MPRGHSGSHSDPHHRDSRHSEPRKIVRYQVIKTRQISTPAPAPPPAPTPSGSRRHESHHSGPRSTQNASRYVLVDRTRQDPTPAPASRPAPASASVPTPALVPQQQQAPQLQSVQPRRTLIKELDPEGNNVTYELYNPPLGKGKFGLVLPCKSRARGWIAVKQVQKSDSEIQLKEIYALQKLRQKGKHTNIIQYFDYFSSNLYRYYTFELADGGSLFEIMARTTMSDRESKLILWQIVNGVSFLHKNACVHRDLKPNNIMFSRPSGLEIKIIDFGGAEWLDEYKGQVSKKVKAIIGTPEYESPEAVKFIVTRGLDIWSIGVILWVMYQGLGHYPVQVPQKHASEDNAAFQARLKVEYEKECQKLKSSDTWTRWRGPPGAMKLCQKMLEPDPYLRILAGEALADEWLSS